MMKNKSGVPANAVIRTLNTENPHRKGTRAWESYSKLRVGMTAKEARRAGCASANLRHNVALGRVIVDMPKAAPQKAKKQPPRRKQTKEKRKKTAKR